jgi:hypothetical protein
MQERSKNTGDLGVELLESENPVKILANSLESSSHFHSLPLKRILVVKASRPLLSLLLITLACCQPGD